MLRSKTRWSVRQADQNKVQELVNELNITPLVASLLVNRGIDTVESARFFLCEENQTFHDPFLFKDMSIAVERIKLAIQLQESILIYGDYDADGVCSTSIMMLTLQELGANVRYYIPNRFTEGYGPNEAAFKKAAKAGVTLIITVDTGIAALNEANIAKELGIDLIITDHHEPGPALPNAYAIIHPKLKDSYYPFTELAGVGVAMKLAHALYGQVPTHLLDIAAIGTVADLVSLQGENRLITKLGIEKLRTTNRIGLKALFKKAQIEQITINEETIGFALAPRINAVGRLDQADPAVNLLLTEDPLEGEQLANKIEQWNIDRQTLVNKITEEAVQIVEEHHHLDENPVLVIEKEGWNSGVIGIVASRLTERFYRPTIVLSIDSETGLAKGSARSIAGFDLFKNLSSCKDILPHFGGHQMAAGMTLKSEDISELKNRLHHLAKTQLTAKDFTPITELDAKVFIEDINIDTILQVFKLAPFGMDNPKPKILIEDVSIASIRKIGADKNHLKVHFEENGITLDAVGFRMGHLYEHISPSSKLSAIGEVSINEWNNIRKPQLFLHDLAVTTWQLFDLRGIKRFEKLVEVIPNENRKWIVFQQNTMDKLKLNSNEEICLIRSTAEAAALQLKGINAVLVDLPIEKELLHHLIMGKTLERIYVHFYKASSDFFSTIPTREHFKWYYAFLAKKGPFDLNKFGDELAKYRGWSHETVDFMSQVFLDLNFAKINNGFISLTNTVKKRDLTESPTYKRKQAQIALEKDLLYSSYNQLKNWFDVHSQEPVKNEEAAKEWI
ncbi:single-stranded-DNA-specific exonuclease RecJ [Bacillus aquiflavi]|uniref:Single-stranded-DNA-specific exonuclease RecJ n=2 Tax=Bacilli TaxID=91061 RepID=A0A6B3VX45_9BACI|nr:single-stranded-DNA-specific exonuclease RecJ [Bacillus aquiflavi]MBA4536500.1 single-stranded-DNA-specific exonuclease RecJ [Bacillus aquiflavi]NEY80867.1 single-stranded-DNA-specific exonuclease RecJ [Bacillus aquiflavi]